MCTCKKIGSNKEIDLCGIIIAILFISGIILLIVGGIRYRSKIDTPFHQEAQVLSRKCIAFLDQINCGYQAIIADLSICKFSKVAHIEQQYTVNSTVYVSKITNGQCPLYDYVSDTKLEIIMMIIGACLVGLFLFLLLIDIIHYMCVYEYREFVKYKTKQDMDLGMSITIVIILVGIVIILVGLIGYFEKDKAAFHQEAGITSRDCVIVLGQMSCKYKVFTVNLDSCEFIDIGHDYAINSTVIVSRNVDGKCPLYVYEHTDQIVMIICGSCIIGLVILMNIIYMVRHRSKYEFIFGCNDDEFQEFKAKLNRHNTQIEGQIEGQIEMGTA